MKDWPGKAPQRCFFKAKLVPRLPIIPRKCHANETMHEDSKSLVQCKTDRCGFYRYYCQSGGIIFIVGVAQRPTLPLAWPFMSKTTKSMIVNNMNALRHLDLSERSSEYRVLKHWTVKIVWMDRIAEIYLSQPNSIITLWSLTRPPAKQSCRWIGPQRKIMTNEVKWIAM